MIVLSKYPTWKRVEWWVDTFADCVALVFPSCFWVMPGPPQQAPLQLQGAGAAPREQESYVVLHPGPSPSGGLFQRGLRAALSPLPWQVGSLLLQLWLMCVYPRCCVWSASSYADSALSIVLISFFSFSFSTVHFQEQLTLFCLTYSATWNKLEENCFSLQARTR